MINDRAVQTRMFMRLAKTQHLLGLIFVGLLVGCAPLTVPKTITWPGQSNSKPQVPLRTTAFWTDCVLNQQGMSGVSGFGARILFYGKDDETPIMVDGSLTVYGYDDTSGDEHSTPSRKFVFPAEYLEKHYSKSDLGHSYSIWIPWQSADGPQRQISLILRFEARKGGAIVISEMSRHSLPGFASEAEQQSSTKTGQPPARLRSTVRQATHETVVEESAIEGLVVEESAPKERMTTTTITLPPRLGRAGSVDAQAADQDLLPATSLPDKAAPGNGTPATARVPQEATQAGPADSRFAPPQASPLDRFARSKPRVPIAPRVPPKRAPLRSRPSPGEWPSDLRQKPPAGQTSGASGNASTVVEGLTALPPVGSP